MSMKLEPKTCPGCGSEFRSIPQVVSGYSNVFQTNDGSYEWGGTTEYEEYTSLRSDDGHILAECEKGHMVPVVDLNEPEAEHLKPASRYLRKSADPHGSYPSSSR